jgi:hypothetical protein
MKRFEDGVPIYRDKKELRTKYDLVHFDGPHKTYDVIKEAIFFAERSRPGTVLFLMTTLSLIWILFLK